LRLASAPGPFLTHLLVVFFLRDKKPCVFGEMLPVWGAEKLQWSMYIIGFFDISKP
jgi:hypothetical protein